MSDEWAIYQGRRDVDLDELERVARAATEGEWELDTVPLDPEHWGEGAHGPYQVQAKGDCDCVVAWFDQLPDWMPDATHIATFDPPTVLALLGRVRRAEADLATAAAELSYAVTPAGPCPTCGYGMVDRDEHGLVARHPELFGGEDG